MKRVTGIGGIFFKAKDASSLQAWYKRHLGIDVQDWGGTAFTWTDAEGKPVAGTRPQLKDKLKMPNFDRRKLICSGIALAVPFGAMPLLAACQQSEDSANADNNTSPNVQGSEEKTMQLQYLEIVTPDVDALCKQYSKVHGIAFSEPNANFGNARTAKLNGGGLIGIRGPLRDSETPVIRPYALVEDLGKAVAAAADAGAEIAIQQMEIPGGHGTIAVVIQGGIECGLWQL